MKRDCLIIGGGVVGLSLAYELVRSGCRVRLLERGELAREASWAGAGILPPANSATAVHAYDQLRGLSVSLHREWAERLRRDTGIDTGYRRCGGLYLARTNGEAAALQGFAEMCREEAIAIEPVSQERLTQLEPCLFASHLAPLKVAYLLPDEAQLRNPWHLRALATAARQLGAELIEHAEVLSFQTRGDVVEAVTTRQGTFAADRFCVAGGAWTQRLLATLGIRNSIIPIRGQMVLFAADRPLIARIINEGSRYLVPRADGHLLAGSTEEEAGFDKSTTAAGIAELTQFAFDIVPALRSVRIEKSWAGLRPGSFDGLPYIGALPGFENAFVAAGHFRSGLYLSPGTALVIRQLMMDEPLAIDLSAFRPSRG